LARATGPRPSVGPARMLSASRKISYHSKTRHGSGWRPTEALEVVLDGVAKVVNSADDTGHDILALRAAGLNGNVSLNVGAGGDGDVADLNIGLDS
jgi:hypothetical protein